MIKHALNNPFILSTAFAAFIHSTWGAGTTFKGAEPHITSWITLFAWAWWVLPAAAIAFSFDVGQILISARIRAGQRTIANYMTFLIFALATYWFQWLYMASHMPHIPLSEGVRPEWVAIAELIRDCSLWVIPALLPISTIMYTFSDQEQLRPENKNVTSDRETSLTIPELTNEEAIVITVPKASTRILHPSANGNGHHDPDQGQKLDTVWNAENL